MKRNFTPLASRRKILGSLLLAPIAAPLLHACSGDDGRDADIPPALTRALARALGSAQLPGAARRAIENLIGNQDAHGETRALYILRGGSPITEYYADGFSATSRLISWSMAKSITAILVGILVGDGRLSLDEPAPIPAWQRAGDPRGGIKLRHLLHMASGLEHVEVGDPIWSSDTVAMLFGDGAANMAAMAEAKPAIAAPGENFLYSSATSVILADIIARSLTDSAVPAIRRQAVRNFIDGRLAGPLGLEHLLVEFDPAGTMIGGSIMHASARDFARLGELLRLGGVAPSGTRILAQSWVDFMRTPSPANPAYGGHIWLNRAPSAPRNGALWPDRGAADLFAFVGHQGQYIVVSPAQAVTMVRLGITTDAQMDALRQTMGLISSAL